MLLGLGRHTLTSCLTTQGRQNLDWSADYRAYSSARLEASTLFTAILTQALERRPPWSRVWLALDDSTLGKTGRRVPLTAWRRDPLSPPFAINLQWGHRVLQASLLHPQSSGGARALPVAFDVLPNRPSHKERARLSANQRREAEHQANVNANAVRQLTLLCSKIAHPVVAAVDGRFANRTFLRHLPQRCTAVARWRKDAALYHPPQHPQATGRPRCYGAPAQSPEAYRQDPRHPWQSLHAHAAGHRPEFRIKVVGPLRSKITGAVDARLIIIAPLGYRLRAGSRLLYRQPAYLWVADPTLGVEEALQGYLWRWEIEVNFRDQKTLLGVGQAQVRHRQSVQRVPAWQVAAYSALLWMDQSRGAEAAEHPTLPRPKWRRKDPGTRASTGQLINQLRYDAWARAIRPESLRPFLATTPADASPPKLETALSSALFSALA